MGNYSDWSDWGCDLAKYLETFLVGGSGHTYKSIYRSIGSILLRFPWSFPLWMAVS